MAKKEMGESKSEQKREEAMDKKQDVAMIKKAFKEHDMQEHKGGKGTKIVLKKGGIDRMAKGGVTGQAMKAMGRNMARAMNQRSSSRGK